MNNFQVFRFTYENSTFIVINAYFPTADKEIEQINTLNRVEGILTDWIGEPIIMVGDFNVTLDGNLERFNYCHNDIRNTRFCTKLCDVLEEFEMEDIWRVRHPHKQTFTWSRLQKASRLDYIFISSFIGGKVNKASHVDSRRF